MDSHQQHLRRGFNWLGGAAIIAKLTDFGTSLIVLLLLTKEQVGIALLVVAFGTIIEALDGLGTSAALVQAPSLSRLQLDSLFWFILGGALVVASVTLLAAPWVASLYGVAGMAAYFLAVAIKQPLVGAAVIPLAIMNRKLQYERIAVVNVCATFATALTRIALAMLGAGAWAIVVAYAASGLYTVVGAWLASPFRPGFRISLSAISPLLRFGLRASTSTLFEQMVNNFHYLFVGWFYGAAPLAEYRVAYDLAMEPANAAGTLINRTARPVFAKASAVREHLAESLTWSLRRLLAVASPLAAATILGADAITALIHDGQGRSYAAASLPLKLLAAAAVLRVVSQLAYPLVIGSGRPQMAVRLSAATLLLLSAGMLFVGFTIPAASGTVAMSAVWLVVHPLLLIWLGRYLQRHWNISAKDLFRAFIAPFVAVGILASTVAAGRLLIGSGSPTLQLGMIVTLAALACMGLLLHDRRRDDRTSALAAGNSGTMSR
jgi:O-antigen/teichoic acid export membrane protein